MTGLSTLHSSSQLKEGLHRMQALSDQGSQGSKKSSQTIWKVADQGKTTTLDKWREYVVVLRSSLVLLLGSLVCCTSRLVD